MKNWKTTLAGIILGAIPLEQGIANSLGTGVSIQWSQIAIGLALVVLGVLSKDFNK